MSQAAVSAVIVSWNSLGYLPSCLRALRDQDTPPGEIIVVDNGSTDGSVEWTRRNHPEVRLLENRSNEGFARANNRGIAASGGEWVLLLNTDVVLEPRFVGVLVDALESDSRFGWGSGKLFRAGETGEAAAAPGRVLDSTGEVFLKTRRFVNRGEGEIDRGLYDRREEVFGVTAAAALYRRAMLEDIRLSEEEYFDGDYFSYLEDSDLNWRARLRGWRCLYEPGAVAHHVRHHATGRGVRMRRHAFGNRYLSLLKNETFINLLLAAPDLMIYEAHRAFRTLFREPELLPAYAKVLRLLPRVLRKRRGIQRRRRVSSRSIRELAMSEDYLGELGRRCRRRQRPRPARSG